MAGGSERSLGRVFAVAFLLWAGLRWYQGRPHVELLLVIAALFLLLAYAAPRLLRPLNFGWMRLGHLLFLVVSPVVLAILFFGTIMPVALLMRALGKDPLRLRRDRAASTYWIARPPSPPDGMTQQF